MGTYMLIFVSVGLTCGGDSEDKMRVIIDIDIGTCLKEQKVDSSVLNVQMH